MVLSICRVMAGLLTGGPADDVESEGVERGSPQPGRVDPGGRKPRRDTFLELGRGSLVERQHQDAARGDEPAADGAGARHG